MPESSSKETLPELTEVIKCEKSKFYDLETVKAKRQETEDEDRGTIIDTAIRK